MARQKLSTSEIPIAGRDEAIGRGPGPWRGMAKPLNNWDCRTWLLTTGHFPTSVYMTCLCNDEPQRSQVLSPPETPEIMKMLDFDTNGTPEALDERNPYSWTRRSHWEGSRTLEKGPGPQIGVGGMAKPFK